MIVARIQNERKALPTVVNRGSNRQEKLGRSGWHNSNIAIMEAPDGASAIRTALRLKLRDARCDPA
jgi:hypothetical protein